MVTLVTLWVARVPSGTQRVCVEPARAETQVRFGSKAAASVKVASNTLLLVLAWGANARFGGSQAGAGAEPEWEGPGPSLAQQGAEADNR